MANLHVDIVSAEGDIHHGEATMVFAPAEMGEVGIAPRHTPLLTRLKPGEVRVKTPAGEELRFFVGGGILEVQPKLVTILADSHVRAVGNGKISIESGGEIRELAADRLLLAQGRRSDDGLADTLRSKGIIVSVVGDSRQVGRVGDAVHMAYRAVQALAAQFGPPARLAC